MIGEVSGRPVAWHALTEEQMTAGARALGMPEPAAAGVSSDVETVTGRKPIAFRTFAELAAPAWK